MLLLTNHQATRKNPRPLRTDPRPDGKRSGIFHQKGWDNATARGRCVVGYLVPRERGAFIGSPGAERRTQREQTKGELYRKIDWLKFSKILYTYIPF